LATFLVSQLSIMFIIFDLAGCFYNINMYLTTENGLENVMLCFSNVFSSLKWKQRATTDLKQLKIYIFFLFRNDKIKVYLLTTV